MSNNVAYHPSHRIAAGHCMDCGTGLNDLSMAFPCQPTKDTSCTHEMIRGICVNCGAPEDSPRCKAPCEMSNHKAMNEPSPKLPEGCDITPLRENLFNLGGALIAKWQLAPSGLQPPSEGDMPRVLAEVYLPTSSKNGDTCLDPDLTFEARLQLFGDYLARGWGTLIDRFRYHNRNFVGKTWREALEKAALYCLDELTKLKTALAIRVEALHSDGWDLVCLARDIQRSGQSIQPRQPITDSAPDEIPF